MDVVLYEPDIPGNAGNVGRTCLATGTPLHLVGRLGFSLDDTHVRRSGLDYWPKVDVKTYRNWDDFLDTVPADAPFYFFSKKASRNIWDATFSRESYLIFGCETSGLPDAIHRRYAKHIYRIPMRPGSVRSLNLSTSVGIVLYEALRQTRLLIDDYSPSTTA